MNPLTLDCLRRWKWLLLPQFLIVTVAWFYHFRLHLEVIGVLAMATDLSQGSVRAQLGLPQRRAAIAAGMWLSVVVVGAAVQVAAMLLGGALLAPLQGKMADPGVLGMHAVFCVLIIGAAQYLLTGLPSAPPRTLAGRVNAVILGLLCMAAMYGGLLIGFFAPISWEAMTPMHFWIMLVLGALGVVSWFTIRRMISERAMPIQEAAPPKRATDPAFLFAGAQGWRLRMIEEVRWLLPTMLGVLVAAVILISIGDYPKGGAAKEGAGWISQYRFLGMLCSISVFPVMMLAAASLRAFRSLPVPLALCSLMVALRPFMAGLAVFLVYTLLNWVIGRGTGMEGRALAAFLPLCGLMSLMQAVMLRHPRLPVAFALLIAFSLASALLPDVMRLPFPSIGLLVLSAVLLVVSWRLHVRWLGKRSRIYRLNQGFLRMAGGAQR